MTISPMPIIIGQLPGDVKWRCNREKIDERKIAVEMAERNNEQLKRN